MADEPKPMTGEQIAEHLKAAFERKPTSPGAVSEPPKPEEPADDGEVEWDDEDRRLAGMEEPPPPVHPEDELINTLYRQARECLEKGDVAGYSFRLAEVRSFTLPEPTLADRLVTLAPPIVEAVKAWSAVQARAAPAPAPAAEAAVPVPPCPEPVITPPPTRRPSDLAEYAEGGVAAGMAAACLCLSNKAHKAGQSEEAAFYLAEARKMMPSNLKTALQLMTQVTSRNILESALEVILRDEVQQGRMQHAAEIMELARVLFTKKE